MKIGACCLIIAAFYATADASEKARYDNYRVYKISIHNREVAEIFAEIENFPDGYRIVSGVNVVGSNLQLVVPPHKFGEFSELQEKLNLQTELLTINLQESIDKEEKVSKRRKSILDWERYWTLEELNGWMESLVVKKPDVVSLFTVGTSYEGRAIRGVKVNIGGTEKKSIFFESMIHSYEHITPSTTTWILNELLTSENPAIRELAERYEWYFLPVFNVDGYAYTWSTDRMWRKSRKPTKSLLCYGADLNRNWDVHFGESTHLNPCHSRYPGDSVFSEPETKMLSEFLLTIPRIVGYFSIHALGQYLMFPYGYTDRKIDTYDILYEIGLKGSEALTAKHGKIYQFGALNEFFDPLSGTSLDWVALNLKPNVTFTFELRPTRDEENINGLGLLLPFDQIVDVSEEVFASIVTILQAAIEKDFA